MVKQQKSPKILIVGAGPTGLMLACELLRHQITPQLIDTRQGIENTNRNVLLHPRTIEILDQLKLLSKFVRHGKYITGIDVYEHNHMLGSMDLNTIDSPHAYLLSIDQDICENILADHLTEQGFHIQWETTLVALDQLLSGVHVQLDHHGVENPHFFSYLAACDGQNSRTRNLLDMRMHSRSKPLWYGQADILLKEEVLAQDRTSIFTSTHGAMCTIPLNKSNLFQCTFTLGQNNSKHTSPIPFNDTLIPSLVEHYSGANWPIENIASCRINRYQNSIVPRYLEGHVFFAGDAATTQSPVAGQGVNNGIQDAHNLAWKIAGYIKRSLSADTLESYHAERHYIGSKLVSDTRNAITALSYRNLLKPWTRTKLIQHVANTNLMCSYALEQLTELGTHYRYSPAVNEAISSRCPHRGPRPGDPIFDSPIDADKATRLFDILNSAYHQLWWFPGEQKLMPPQQIIQAIRPYLAQNLFHVHFFVNDLPLIVADEFDNHQITVHTHTLAALHEVMSGPCDTLYLIRPDGYVAWRSRHREITPFLRFLERYFNLD